jgi:hypothetical protein
MRRVDLIENFKVVGTEPEEADQIVDLAIIQGSQYQLTLRYPEDLTGQFLFSQIRKAFAQDEGITTRPLASFNFSPLVYDSNIEKTIITMQLSASDTGKLPYTVYQNKKCQELSIDTCYVFDLKAKNQQGLVKNLLPYGYVQVRPEVSLWLI